LIFLDISRSVHLGVHLTPGLIPELALEISTILPISVG
jgi:hypothetical protein